MAPRRQADFLGALAETRSVLEAARRVSMARESAYRLRRKPGAASFAAAWDKVIGQSDTPTRKVTDEYLVRRATEGVLKPPFYGGKHVATVEKADNSALLAVIAQLGRAGPTEATPAGRSQSFTIAATSTPPPGGKPYKQASR